MDTLNRKKNAKKNAPLIIVLSIVALLLIAVVVVYLVFHHYYKLTDLETTAAETEVTVESTAEAEVTETEFETVAPEEESSIAASISEDVEEAIERNSDGTDKLYNVLLIGVDRRDASWNGNSDAMVLMTVNYTDKTVMMTSFMRDTGVQIPNVGLRKLNAAYAIGAGPLLVETIQSNFGIQIDNYAWVDFGNMEQVIDALGGVDMKLTVAEASHIGISISSDQVVHLSGAQALAHSRNRSTGGSSDFGRTQRQRDVLMALVSKMKSQGAKEMMASAETVLPLIHHNLDEGSLFGLLMKMPNIIGYDFAQQRIPYDGQYGVQNELLIPNFSTTIDRLHQAMNNEGNE